MTYPEPRQSRGPIPNGDTALGLIVGVIVTFMAMAVVNMYAFTRITNTICIGLGWDSGYAEDTYKGYCVRVTDTEKYECRLSAVMSKECILWNTGE